MSDSQAHAPADERAPSSPKMTTSTILLTIVLISSLLQIVPFPGFFLMLLLAAFWPIVLVNLAMVFILFEVRVKEQPKFMILMPIIYFGGYLIAVFFGHYYQNKVKLRNMFDKSVDFVRSSDTIYISDLPGFDPVEFLRHYQNTVVIVSGSYDIDDRREPKIYETMDKSACDVADIANVEIAYRSAGPGGNCISISTTSETQPESSVFVGFDARQSYTRVRHALQIDVTSVYVARKSFHGNFFIERQPIPLYWFPLPYFGCGLIDNPPAWKCEGGFVFDKDRARIEDLTDRIADGLGLERRSPEL